MCFFLFKKQAYFVKKSDKKEKQEVIVFDRTKTFSICFWSKKNLLKY